LFCPPQIINYSGGSAFGGKTYAAVFPLAKRDFAKRWKLLASKLSLSFPKREIGFSNFPRQKTPFIPAASSGKFWRILLKRDLGGIFSRSRENAPNAFYRLMIKKTSDFQTYLEDTSNLKGHAECLYLPESKEEVRFLIGECNRSKSPLTVSAGRTGTTAGCVPLSGALLSLQNLNKIINIDAGVKEARVEAGVLLEDLLKEAVKFNLTLRASPTEPLAYAGGAVSTAASGVRGFGYGSIRNYVRAIEIVLAGGDVLKIQRGKIFSLGRAFDFTCGGKRFKFNLPSYDMPPVKSQAGFFVKDNMDLIDLFIGSEGVLGIITECCLSLQTIAPYIIDGLVFFDCEEKALGFSGSVKSLKRDNLINPASLEFFDHNSLELLGPVYSFIPASAAAAIYFEQEAEDKSSSEQLMDTWAKLIENGGASLDTCIIADNPNARRSIFEFRHKVPQLINEFLRAYGQQKIASDIAVPPEHFAAMYESYKSTARETALRYVNFGHIGEGHLHFNFLPRSDQESVRAGEGIARLCRQAVAWGGTVCAEHGVGKVKKPYLKIMYGDKHIKEMAALKKYFDPNCILNLDNIFDKEFLL